MKFDIRLSAFRKPVEKIQVSLKSEKIKGTLHEDQCTLLIISRSVLLKMRSASGKLVEMIATHIMSFVTLFSKILPFMR